MRAVQGDQEAARAKDVSERLRSEAAKTPHTGHAPRRRRAGETTMAKLWLVAAAALAQATTYEEKLARDPNKRYDPEAKIDIAIIMPRPLVAHETHAVRRLHHDERGLAADAHQIMTYLRPRIADADLFLHTWSATKANK